VIKEKMSNNCSIQTDFTETNTLITTVDTVVDAIRAVDVPVLTGGIATIAADTGNIRVTDFPTTDALIGALKPARGKTKRYNTNNGSVDWEYGLNIPAGKGKLLYGYFSLATLDADRDCIEFFLDGNAYIVPNSTALKDVEYALSYQDRATNEMFAYDTNLEANVRMLNYEFKTNMALRLRRPNSAGASTVDVTLFYIED